MTIEKLIMEQIVYFNGKFVPESQAMIPINTHALHYGTACFGGLRAYYIEKDQTIIVPRIEDNFKRFMNSCKLLFIDLPYGVEDYKKLVIELVQKNFAKTDLYVRPLAYKSDRAVGNFNLTTLKSGFLMYTTPLGRYMDTEQGIRVNTSSWRRIPDSAIPPRGKVTGTYVNSTLAKTESLLNGYDEALLLDIEGHITEGSTENFFMVRNEKVITPPLSDDILQGITRDTILKLCNDLKIPVEERSIDRSEVYSADEVFLVGTAAEVTPVTEVDKREVGNGEIGVITKQLKDTYFKFTHGQYPKYKELITEIKSAK